MFLKQFTLCILLLFVSVAFAGPATVVGRTVTRKVVSETIEQAAKRSGKALTPAVRKTSEKLLVNACKQYGDDVLKAVSHGGLEVLEQGGKHGKVFWQLCAHFPQGARSLALHADELLPIARRIGPDFMKLETHVPGLGKKAVECFGDDAVRALLKLSPDDAAKLIAYGAKADSPKTAGKLLKATEKTGGTILKQLDGKKILAVGLTASMVTAAYKVSDGVEDGLKNVSQNSPENFTRAVERPLTYVGVIGSVGLLGFLFWFFSPARRLLGNLFSKKKPAVTSTPGEEPEAVTSSETASPKEA